MQCAHFWCNLTRGVEDEWSPRALHTHALVVTSASYVSVELQIILEQLADILSLVAKCSIPTAYLAFRHICDLFANFSLGGDVSLV